MRRRARARGGLAALPVLIALAVLPGALAACGSPPSSVTPAAPSVAPGSASPAATAPASASPAADLPGTSWTVTGYAGTTGVATGVLPGMTVTLEFGDGGRASGSGGCNRYGGDYLADPATGTLAFGPLATTDMACAEAGVMTQEPAYLAALARAVGYRIGDDGTLTLLDGRGDVVVEAEPAPSVF